MGVATGDGTNIPRKTPVSVLQGEYAIQTGTGFSGFWRVALTSAGNLYTVNTKNNTFKYELVARNVYLIGALGYYYSINGTYCFWLYNEKTGKFDIEVQLTDVALPQIKQ